LARTLRVPQATKNASTEFPSISANPEKELVYSFSPCELTIPTLTEALVKQAASGVKLKLGSLRKTPWVFFSHSELKPAVFLGHD
jgi:hypothetical protein